MFHSTPVSAKQSKRRRSVEEEQVLENLACAIRKDDQDDEIRSYFHDDGGSSGSDTGFDYSNMTFSDDYSTSEFSFSTPSAIDSIRKKLLSEDTTEANHELNRRRNLFDGLSDDENEEILPVWDMTKGPPVLAMVRKFDAVCHGDKKDFNMNHLVAMTYKSFNLNEDLKSCDEEKGQEEADVEEEEERGVSEDDDTGL